MKYGEDQIRFLENKNYLQNGETLEERINTVVNVVKEYEKDYSDGLAERIRFYINEQILSLSTPQWANFGRYKESGSSPLPVSCYIIHPENSIQGIYYSMGEAAMMSKLGGGVGADFTQIYDRGTKLAKDFYSNPKLDWAEDYVRTGQKVSQSSQRRGYVVPSISIDDPEFDDLIKRSKKNNPDKKDPFVNNNICIILPSGFRERMKDGDKEAQRRYRLVLQVREESGRAYILDVDNCNKNKSPVYEKLGHVVDATNICTEALTPKYKDKSFTCVLSSLNLNHWDRIKADPQIIKDAFMFLDITCSEFIKLSEGIPFMEKARRSAIEKRDIGLGTLGFHDYLQSKDCIFGSLESMYINEEIYSTIRKYGEEYTVEIGEKLGSPKMCQDADMVRRNVSLMMVAPNKSTSFICGESSLGIEPLLSNVFSKTIAGITTTVKNRNLQKILAIYGKDTRDVWESILNNLGSVQHLDFLSDHYKKVYKTASEISPKDMINLAAQRQKYIDMSQSLNLWNRPNYSKKDIINIHNYAFKMGIKTVYYYWSQAHAGIEVDGDDWDVCESCAD